MTDPNKSADAQPVAWGYAHSMWKTRDISCCLTPPRISAKQTQTHKLPVYLAPPDMDALRAENAQTKAALRGLLEALASSGVELDCMSKPTPLIDLLNSEKEFAAVEAARAALEGKSDD